MAVVCGPPLEVRAVEGFHSNVVHHSVAVRIHGKARCVKRPAPPELGRRFRGKRIALAEIRDRCCVGNRGSMRGEQIRSPSPSRSVSVSRLGIA